MSVNFSNAIRVISSAQKLVIKCPKGPSTASPPLGTISPYGQNNHIHQAKIWIHNHVDTKDDSKGTWQGMDDINGVFIANAVPNHIQSKPYNSL